MTTKRELLARIKRLDEAAVREQGYTEIRRKESSDAIKKHTKLLDNLLVLDPSLDRFRIDIESNGWEKPRDWDFEGIATAVAHNAGKAAAERFVLKGGRA